MTVSKKSQDGTGFVTAGINRLFSCNKTSFILTLLGSGHQNIHETYQCRIYSRKLLMMGREGTRYM